MSYRGDTLDQPFVLRLPIARIVLISVGLYEAFQSLELTFRYEDGRKHYVAALSHCNQLGAFPSPVEALEHQLKSRIALEFEVESSIFCDASRASAAVEVIQRLGSTPEIP
jgi:hypothetical protein